MKHFLINQHKLRDLNMDYLQLISLRCETPDQAVALLTTHPERFVNSYRWLTIIDDLTIGNGDYWEVLQNTSDIDLTKPSISIVFSNDKKHVHNLNLNVKKLR